MNFLMKAVLLVVAFPFFAQAQEVCNQGANPHSYACESQTFQGSIFPMANMRNEGVAFGTWKLLTFSGPGDNTPAEFDLLTDSNNPLRPVGLVNNDDDSMVGDMQWNRDGVWINDWRHRGNTISAAPGAAWSSDDITMNVTLRGPVEEQGLQCRMFLRVGKDHLLCRWFTKRNGQFVFRGYLGFGE